MKIVSLQGMKQHFISDLQKLLNTSQKIVILPHKNPDGDALGSTLALRFFLLKKKHEVVVISPNDYPDFLNVQTDGILHGHLKQKLLADEYDVLDL